MVNVDDQFGEILFFQFENHMFQHGRPATGTKALGMWSVSGLSRVPSPAANIMAFIWLSVIGLFVVPDESSVH